MNLHRLKWLTAILVIAFMLTFEYVRHFVFLVLLHTWPVYFLSVAAVVAAILLFNQAVFAILQRMEQKILQQNRQLATLNAVAEAVSRVLDVNEVLNSALDRVLEFMGVDAGVICLLDQEADELVLAAYRGLSEELVQTIARAKINEELDGVVVRKGNPLVVENALEDPRVQEIARREGIQSFASVPLRSKSEIVGVFGVASRHLRQFPSSDIELLTAVGRHLGVVIDNAKLFRQAQRREREAQALYKVSTEVLTLLDLDKLLHSVTEKATELLECEIAALCFLDEQSQELVVGATSGPVEAFKSKAKPLRHEGLVDELIKSGTVVQMDGCYHDELALHCPVVKPEYRRAHMAVPLKRSDRVMGVFCVGNQTPRQFSQGDVNLLSGLASQAAIAIENARLYQQVQDLAILRERERIAREMHDSLGQVLGYVNTKAQAVRELLSAGQVAAAEAQLDQLVEAAQEVYADVREAIVGLRSAISTERGLLPALTEYLHHFSRQSGIKAELVVDGEGATVTFPPSTEIQLIRIIQEALTNVRKYARAKHAWVQFEVDGGQVQISIEDDGVGFDPSRISRQDWPQFGLQTMQERAEAVGGAFELQSSPGQGTRVTVKVPLGQAGGR